MTPLALYVNQKMQALAIIRKMLFIVYGPSSQEQFLMLLLLLLLHLDVLVTIFSAYRFPILFLTC